MTITIASQRLDIDAPTIRYWCDTFSIDIARQHKAPYARIFTERDIELIRNIQQLLLYFSIKGLRRFIEEKRDNGELVRRSLNKMVKQI